MQRYLVIYGAENEMATFDADDPNNAVAQAREFIDDLSVEINEVLLCSPVIGWNEHDDGCTAYVMSNSGSWFGAEDMNIVAVPDTLDDADSIEAYLQGETGIN